MKLKKNGFMKDGLNVRDFQNEAIWFMLNHSKSLLALPVGSGKTITAFSTYTYVKSKTDKTKLIYVTEKPLVRQTVYQDLPKYFKGLKHTHIYNHNKKERKLIYNDWLRDKDILILNYHSVRIDFDILGEILQKLFKEKYNLMSVYDEATAFKNPKAEISKCISLLSKASTNCYGMTATPLSSGLYDCYHILNTIGCPPYKTKTY